MGLTEKDNHSDDVKRTDSIKHLSVQTGGSFQGKNTLKPEVSDGYQQISYSLQHVNLGTMGQHLR